MNRAWVIRLPPALRRARVRARSGEFRRVCVWVVALVLLATAAPADRVTLTNGQVLTGEILTSDTAKVRLRLEGSISDIARRRIRSIEMDSPARNRVLLGRTTIGQGAIAKGLEEWLGALQDEPEAAADMLANVVELQGDGLTEDFSRIATGERPLAAIRLGRLAGDSRIPTSARFFFLECLAPLGSPAEVEQALRSFEAGPLRDDPRRKQFAANFWRRRVRELLQESRFPEALEAVERLRVVDPESGRPERGLIVLTRAAQLRDAGRLPESLQVLAEELHPLLPEIARNRIDSVVASMPEWVELPEGVRAEPTDPRVAERFRAAREAILGPLAKVEPMRAQAALTTLLSRRARVLLDAGESTSTLVLLRDNDTSPPLTSLERIRDEATFLNRFQRIRPDDSLSMYRLGLWALDHERNDWAREAFLRVMGPQSLIDLAKERLISMAQREDAASLQRALEAYRAGKSFDALEELTPILRRTGAENSPVYREARKLADLARGAAQDETRKRPYQADVVLQKAEREFYGGDTDGAILSLVTLLREYGDTPAGARGRLLLPQVMRVAELERAAGARRPLPEIPREIREQVSASDSGLDSEMKSILEALNRSVAGDPTVHIGESYPTPAPTPVPDTVR